MHHPIRTVPDRCNCAVGKRVMRLIRSAGLPFVEMLHSLPTGRHALPLKLVVAEEYQTVTSGK